MSGSSKILLALLTAALAAVIIVIAVFTAEDKKHASEIQTVTDAAEEQGQTTEAVRTTAEETTAAQIANEKPVVLFMENANADKTYTKVTEYESAWSRWNDIGTFEAFNTTKDEFSYENYYTVHAAYWDAVETDTVYKIGYELSFEYEGERLVYTILSPSDIEDNPDLFMGDVETEETYGFMGVWVYCDMNQTGHYSHLTSDDFTDETLMTSIKLHPMEKSFEISNLTLKAFSYSSELEFDADGHYIGSYGYEIPVTNIG